MSINFGDNAAFDITGDLTLEAWGWGEVSSTSSTNALIAKDFCYGMAFGNKTGGAPGFIAKIGDGSSIQGTIEDTNIYVEELWFHFAMTYSDSNDRIRLYVNGTQVKEDTSFTASLGTNDEVLEGANWDNQGWGYSGKIDAIRLWSVERTQTELSDNMNQELDGDETGLEGLWRINNGSGTTVDDATSNNNDGSLSGHTWVERGLNIGGAFGSPQPSGDVGLSAPFAADKVGDGNYVSDDGNRVAFFDFDVPVLSHKAKVQQLVYRRTASNNEWNIAETLENPETKRTVRIDGLVPGEDYDVGLRAISAEGTKSSVTLANNNSFTAPTKTNAPSTPSGLTTDDKFGRKVNVSWTDIGDSDTAFYRIYRHTSNDFSNASAINNEVRDITWTDTNFSQGDYGTEFFYWITSVDSSGNESAASGEDSVTLTKLGTGDVDDTLHVGGRLNNNARGNTIVFTSSQNWEVPTGVNSVYLTGCAGGGGGGHGGSNGGGGGGGGESVYNFLITGLTPGNTISIDIGAGGSGGSSGVNDPGGDGANTKFGSHITLQGGEGGTDGNTSSNKDGSGGGSGTQFIESVSNSNDSKEGADASAKIQGGDGGRIGTGSGNGLGGGSSAFGDGGDGGGNSNSGDPGKFAGGGGGGGDGEDSNEPGGDGADGFLAITY